MSKPAPFSVFADRTQIFATHKFIARLADAVEENVKNNLFPKDIQVGVEGDTIVKFYSDRFTVTCTRIIDDAGIYAVNVACSKSLGRELKEYHTLEFIHKKLSTYFGTSAAQPDADHNINDMLKQAELVDGRTVVSSSYGEPIGLLFADPNDRHQALRRLKMVDAEFKDETQVIAGDGFVNLLKTALDYNKFEGVTLTEDDQGHLVIKWETGEVHITKCDPGVNTVDFYTLSELASMTRTILRWEFIRETSHKVLFDRLPDNPMSLELLTAIQRLALAVPTDPESISEPFLMLYSTEADKARILEAHMNTHSEDNKNSKPESTGETIRDKAEQITEKVVDGVAGAAETIGAAADNAAENLREDMERVYHGAEALLEKPTFFDRATQFTKDHARDMVFGAIGFVVGVAATVVIKR